MNSENSEAVNKANLEDEAIFGEIDARLGCYSTLQFWFYEKLTSLENLYHSHHWKFLGLLLPLFLLCFGLKMVTIQTDFYKLWVQENSTLFLELNYQARVLHNDEMRPSSIYWHSSSLVDRFHLPRMPPLLNYGGKLQSPPINLNGMPGSEFLGSMEAVIQTIDGYRQLSDVSGLLTPKALLDHVNLLIKIQQLEVSVGKSKWKLEDLCRRAEMPHMTGIHVMEGYSALIPCLVITPADCFWEGSKVLSPDKVVHIPWFNEQLTLQWPDLNPSALLYDFKRKYGNLSTHEWDEMIDLFDKAGISNGYLTRPCLDPLDGSCPELSPNHGDQASNLGSILSHGCPGFASKMLHWSGNLIIGGQLCLSKANQNSNSSLVSCQEKEHLSQNYTHRHENKLQFVSAFQSLILLRSPQDLYKTVRLNDPYNLDISTLADAQHVLDQWRNGLKQLLLTRNKVMSMNQTWKYYAFTENAVRDLLTQTTLETGTVLLVGVFLLMLLHSLLCLLDWREPVRSQCWLALLGLMLNILTVIAGFGVCATLGLPFNVLSIQILPFLVFGLGMEGLFVFTTCHACLSLRISGADKKPEFIDASHVLAEHGTGLVFGALTLSTAFFSMASIPVPALRHFGLQAGILILLQTLTQILIFPALLKLDVQRRASQRVDVLCCLKQSQATIIYSNQQLKSPSIDCETINTTIPMQIVQKASTKIHLHDVSKEKLFSAVKVSISTKTPSIFASKHQHLQDTTHSGSLAYVPTNCINKTTRKANSYPNIIDSNRDENSSTELFNGFKDSSMTEIGQKIGLHPECEHLSQSSLCGKIPLLSQFANILSNLLIRSHALRLLVGIFGLGIVLAVFVFSPFHLRLGINMMSLAPRDSMEHNFLHTSSTSFGLIYFDLIARGTELHSSNNVRSPGFLFSTSQSLTGPGIDFPLSQSRLRQLYNSVTELPGVSLTGKRVWLDLMCDWLEDVQKAFDMDRRLGHISSKGVWNENASHLGILGLRLIIQTTNGIQLSRINTARLLTNRIIDSSVFLVYLSAWRSYDVFNYTAPPCVIFPDPPYVDLSRSGPSGGSPRDLELIPPSNPIDFVQTSFFATGYHDISSQLELVLKVRELTEIASSQGVPVFPIGVPFTVGDHHIHLWHYAVISSGIITGAFLFIGLLFLPNPVSVLLAVGVGGGGALSAGLIGMIALGLHLNVMSYSLLLFAFGLGVKLSVGVLTGWYGPQHNVLRIPISSTGLTDRVAVIASQSSRKNVILSKAATPEFDALRCRKLANVLRNHIGPVSHSIVSLFLSIALIAASRIDFIADHFFRLVSFICIFCLFNTLIVLPILCFLMEPIYPSQTFTFRESGSLSVHPSTAINLKEQSFQFPNAAVSNIHESYPVENSKFSSTTSDSPNSLSSISSAEDKPTQPSKKKMECYLNLKIDRDLQSAIALLASLTSKSTPELASRQTHCRPDSLSTIAEESSHSGSYSSLHTFQSSPGTISLEQSLSTAPSAIHSSFSKFTKRYADFDDSFLTRAVAMAAADIGNKFPASSASRFAINILPESPKIVTLPPAQMRELISAVVAVHRPAFIKRIPAGSTSGLRQVIQFLAQQQHNQSNPSPPPYSSVCIESDPQFPTVHSSDTTTRVAPSKSIKSSPCGHVQPEDRNPSGN